MSVGLNAFQADSAAEIMCDSRGLQPFKDPACMQLDKVKALQ
jgi:hypothetical protein